MRKIEIFQVVKPDVQSVARCLAERLYRFSSRPEAPPYMPEGVYALAYILMYPLPLLPVFPYVTFPKSFTHNGLEYLLYGRNIGGVCLFWRGRGWGGGSENFTIGVVEDLDILVSNDVLDGV